MIVAWQPLSTILVPKTSCALFAGRTREPVLFVLHIEVRSGTATNLAELMAAQGRREEARLLLEPLFEWFEGHGTANLKAVEHLLATLQ
jgi:hypothetical protein